jgi:hypothetical protein
VENHKTSIPIAGLERLAHALKVPMGVFFEEDLRTAPLTVCRAGHGRASRLRGMQGYPFEMLAGEKKGKLMEI